MVIIKIEIEKTVLAVFFGILLFIGPGNLFAHKIMHDYPYGYFASDTFQHQVRADAIKDAGNFRYEANYISHGLDNVVGRYPPILYHLAVIFSYASGLEVYDAIYFVVFFFAILGAFLMYFVIRNFNKNVALISLPLMVLMIAFPVNTFSFSSLASLESEYSTGFIFGHWPSMLGQFFLVAFAWCIMKIDLEKSYIFIAIILSAIILTHTSEAVFAVIFLLLFAITKFIGKSITKADIKKTIIAAGITLLLTIYYITIFKNTWASSQPYTFKVDAAWNGNPGFYILGFGVLLVFIIIGIIAAFFRLKNMDVALVFGLSMLLAGFMNYIGFELRSFQIRFFWPVYLSVFFGLGIYLLLKSIVKNWNIFYSVLPLVVFIVLILGIVKIPSVPHYSKNPDSAGLMDAYHWSALNWLSINAEQNSRIYFFYGDIYGQDALLRNSKRVHYLVDPDDFKKSLKEGKIKRSYLSKLPGDSGGGLKIKTGIFSFQDALDSKPDDYLFGPRDICGFEYAVFDKVLRYDVLAKYNMLIASELLKKDYIKNAFENEVAVILKNSKTGDDCIA